MDREIFERLNTPEGQRLLARAGDGYADRSADPLALASRLRKEHAPDLVAAALTQARLRHAAVAKFGADAEVMFFTAEGLEQATTRPVAEHRAARLAAAVPPGAAAVDLGCGLGGDLIALARAGLSVTGVERDPLTTELARANLRALGLDGRVEQADATEVARDRFAAVLADPARRDTSGRVFDPDAYSPPWWFVRRLLADPTAATCVKTAPIIDHDRIEPGVTAEWVSLDGEVKEAALWSGPGLADSRSARTATVLRHGRAAATLGTSDDPGEADVLEPTPQRPPGYLYEPDSAVIRAGLVTAVAPLIEGSLIHPRIAYLVSEELVPTPFARAYRIEQVLPYGQNHQKRLRRRLAELGVGRLTVKKRGLELDPEQVRKRLVSNGPNAATLILTRTATSAVALITRPVESG